MRLFPTHCSKLCYFQRELVGRAVFLAPSNALVRFLIEERGLFEKTNLHWNGLPPSAGNDKAPSLNTSFQEKVIFP